MGGEIPTGRPLRLLYMLYEKSRPVAICTIQLKQSELAKQLGISRQALNVHLRKLRDEGHIRTGRGFIDITERGLGVMGISTNPAFIFIKVSPLKRREAYQRVTGFPIQRVFRVAGDMDAILVVEPKKLDEVLRRLASMDGVLDTRSYVSIETLK